MSQTLIHFVPQWVTEDVKVVVLNDQFRPMHNVSFVSLIVHNEVENACIVKLNAAGTDVLQLYTLDETGFYSNKEFGMLMLDVTGMEMMKDGIRVAYIHEFEKYLNHDIVFEKNITVFDEEAYQFILIKQNVFKDQCLLINQKMQPVWSEPNRLYFHLKPYQNKNMVWDIFKNVFVVNQKGLVLLYVDGAEMPISTIEDEQVSNNENIKPEKSGGVPPNDPLGRQKWEPNPNDAKYTYTSEHGVELISFPKLFYKFVWVCILHEHSAIIMGDHSDAWSSYTPQALQLFDTWDRALKYSIEEAKRFRYNILRRKKVIESKYGAPAFSPNTKSLTYNAEVFDLLQICDTQNYWL